MGFDLKSDCGDKFWINNTGWRYLLTFAELQGFHWPLNSAGDEGEDLNADEALSLANALEKGLGNRSSSDIAPEISNQLTRLLVTESDSSLFRDDKIELKPKTIDYWREFICFARKGGFSLTR